MTKARGGRAVTPRPPASSAASRVALPIDVRDVTIAQQLVAAGARIGVDVNVRVGATPVVVDDGETLVHQLRTEALVAVEAVDLAADVGARARRLLAGLVGAASAKSAAIVREEADGRLSLVLREHLPIDLGEPPEAARALRAARVRRSLATTPDELRLPPDAEVRARAITFGPTRTLSDPSSRRVLEAFGFTCAPWRLAETAARAAAHARAIGHPVDLRVASPDVSSIDDAQLEATELRTPGEVREAFRTLTREVRRLAPNARTLGLTVTRHVVGAPRLRLALLRGGGDRLRIELDDPIGRRLSHALVAAAPIDRASAARVVEAFDGRSVLPRADSLLGRALLDLLVRLSHVGTVMADTLTGAELAPIVPAEETWSVLCARVSVRGIELGDG